MPDFLSAINGRPTAMATRLQQDGCGQPHPSPPPRGKTVRVWAAVYGGINLKQAKFGSGVVNRSGANRPISPSPAGRSPQRGRVGVGVEASMSSPKRKRHPNLPRLIADENPGSNCCDSRLPSFSCEAREMAGEGGKREKWAFDSPTISLTPTPSLPRCGFLPAGEGGFMFTYT